MGKTDLDMYKAEIFFIGEREGQKCFLAQMEEFGVWVWFEGRAKDRITFIPFSQIAMMDVNKSVMVELSDED